MNIESELRTVLIEASLGDAVDADRFVAGSVELKDLGIDSLELFELVSAIEVKFDIQVEDTEVDAIRTFTELLQLVSAKVSLDH